VNNDKIEHDFFVKNECWKILRAKGIWKKIWF